MSVCRSWGLGAFLTARNCSLPGPDGVMVRDRFRGTVLYLLEWTAECALTLETAKGLLPETRD